MCGRYYIDDDTYQSISALVDEDNFDQNYEKDFYPSENIPIIIKQNNHFILESYKWGFPLNQSLVINAREETIQQKALFKNHIKNNRCIIPAQGFYEWDIHKRRFAFEMESSLYMLGIYREIEKDVVIITTKANQTMKPIHSRMPLIISKDQIDIWFDDSYYQSLFTKGDIDLKIIDGIMQQSLF